MIYKDFIAEAAQKMMAAGFAQVRNEVIGKTTESQAVAMSNLACDAVEAAKQLAEVLEEDYKNEDVDGGIRRYAEGETFFDNYVNWTKTK